MGDTEPKAGEGGEPISKSEQKRRLKAEKKAAEKVCGYDQRVFGQFDLNLWISKA